MRSFIFYFHTVDGVLSPYQKFTSWNSKHVNIKATRADHESNTTSTLMVHKKTMQILWFFIRFLHGIDFEVLSTYESFSGTAA